MKFESLAIRTQMGKTYQKEHSTPMYPTSSFTFDNAEEMRAVFAEEEQGNVYSRYSNPSVREFEDKLAILEGGEACIATASGMSAVFTTFACLLGAGDHILMSQAVFGSTIKIADNFLNKWGIEHDLVNSTDIEVWNTAIKPNTKVIYIETPSNPGLTILDIAALAGLCKPRNIKLVVDNCFATPYLQNPITHGADIVIHSATKYIDGQGRVLGGAIIGTKEDMKLITPFIRNAGPTLSPFNAWILSKSLETLPVRMDRHCENAEKVANWLSSCSKVTKVNYPFLSNHPHTEIARKQMRKGGGIVSFELAGGLSAGRSVIDSVQMFSISPNLGDTRSILVHPASSTHSKIAEQIRQEVGITDGLLRLSVGLEHIDDILADLDQSINN